MGREGRKFQKFEEICWAQRSDHLPKTDATKVRPAYQIHYWWSNSPEFVISIVSILSARYTAKFTPQHKKAQDESNFFSGVWRHWWNGHALEQPNRNMNPKQSSRRPCENRPERQISLGTNHSVLVAFRNEWEVSDTTSLTSLCVHSLL